jgi:hypothetical protein
MHPSPIGDSPGLDAAAASGRDRAARGRRAASSEGPDASSVDDPVGDPEDSGVSPAFIDIRRASIRDAGADMRLTLTLAGVVPDRLPADDYAYVEFRLEGDGRGVSVAAEGDDTGWTPVIEGRRFTGTFALRDASMVFVVPWRAIGAGGSLEWFATSSWTHSGLLSTDYGFDRAPDAGPAPYPD